MPTKREILDSITEKEYNSSEVKTLVNSVRLTRDSPTKFKKGDVIISIIGSKGRPGVVIKVTKNLLYVIPLTTTQDDMAFCNYNSRFFGEGFFSKCILAVKLSHAEDNFAGVFDDRRNLNKAIKELKSILLTVF